MFCGCFRMQKASNCFCAHQHKGALGQTPQCWCACGCARGGLGSLTARAQAAARPFGPAAGRAAPRRETPQTRRGGCAKSRLDGFWAMYCQHCQELPQTYHTSRDQSVGRSVSRAGSYSRRAGQDKLQLHGFSNHKLSTNSPEPARPRAGRDSMFST